MVGCQGVEVIKKNCDKTQKLQTQKLFNWTKFKNLNSDKTKKENCDKTQNSNCDKTQKLKLRQNLKTQIVTKLKNSNCDKTKKKSNIVKTKQS